MKKLLLLLPIFVGMLMPLLAQQDRLQIVPKGEEGLGLRPEIRVAASFSVPLGKFAQLDSVSSNRGCAKMGGGIDLVLTHRLRRSPLVGVQIATGYLQHGFKSEEVKERYQLASFICKPWSSIYLMPGIGLQVGKRFKLEVSANVGLVMYNGWNGKRAEYETEKNGYYWTREWKYAWRMAGGFRGGLLLGYKINERALFFVQGWVQYARGSRIGNLTKTFYNLDNQGIPEETPSSSATSRVIQPTVLFTMNAGIGIKYNLYKYLNEPTLPSETEKLR